MWILVHWPFWSPSPGLVLLSSPKREFFYSSLSQPVTTVFTEAWTWSFRLGAFQPSVRCEGSFKKQQTFHSYETLKQLARVHLFCFRGRFMFFIKMWFWKIERALKMLLQWKKDKLEDIFHDQRQKRECAWALTKLDLFTPLLCKPGQQACPPLTRHPIQTAGAKWAGALGHIMSRLLEISVQALITKPLDLHWKKAPSAVKTKSLNAWSLRGRLIS